MAAPTTTLFMDAVSKSGLVDAKQLEEYFGSSMPEDPNQCANLLIKAELLTSFQVKQLMNGKVRGFFLGPYKILRPLGQGGMGTVYLAEHTSLKRKVAVKVLNAEKAKDNLALERFNREARAAAALDHPNIVRLHDISQGAGVHFLVMEYVEGTDLQALLAQTGPMHYAQATNYIAQTAAGLQHAHDKGFIHRDIKPSNLILTRDGTVKILDMGLARSFVDERDNLTALVGEKDVAGTVDYLSPEQAMNQPLDERSDLYSLGVTLYSLVTGHPPFNGTTAQKLLQHQLKDPPSMAVKLRGRVPEALSVVVTRMMAKKPSDRFQTASDVIDALGPWLPALSTGNIVRDPLSATSLTSTPAPRRPLTAAKPTTGFRQRLGEAKALAKRRPLLFGGSIAAAVASVAAFFAFSGSSKPVAAEPPPVAKVDPTPVKQPATAKVVPTLPKKSSAPTTAMARGKFKMLPFGASANSCAGGPLFAQFANDRFEFEAWGEYRCFDVPFYLPNTSDRDANIICLYGPISEPTKLLPRSARIPVGSSAATLHFLSGISAWGWPHEGRGEFVTPKGSTVMTVRLIYEDGETEEYDWKNGEQFADFARPFDVPESEFAFQARNGKQVRYLKLNPKRPTQPIQAIEFVKNDDDNTCPAIIAVTADAGDGTSPPAAIPGNTNGRAPGNPKAAPVRNLIPLEIAAAATEFALQPPAPGRWGARNVAEIPFVLLDPKGGQRPNVVQPKPGAAAVLPCYLAVKSIHVLGGGNAEPGTTFGRMRLKYVSGETELLDCKTEVPSTFDMELPGGGRTGYFQVRPTRTAVIRTIEIEAADTHMPAVVAVTVETL